jgi:carboxyl-terminal processing protease
LPKKALKVTGIVILVIFIAACVFASGLFVGEKKAVSDFMGAHVSLITTGNNSDFKILDEIYGIVNAQYVEKVSKDKLVEGAITGMLDSLGDEYTRHFKPKDFQHIDEITQGRFEGIGMTMEILDNGLAITSVLENTPAAGAGLKVNDQLLEIDGKTTANMTVDTAISKIRGKAGTEVKLKIARDGGEPFNVTIKRAEIRIPNIQFRMEGDVGYIRLIHSFDSSAGEEVRAEMKKLKDQGAKGIIFDLRGNPGGLLMSGVDVASAFIDKGVIVSIKERKGAERKYTAVGKSDGDIPLIILVNKGSASASEIVAGAIQDYERGPIIGDQTYGKGSVQTVLDLSDGSGLIITTAKYFTPKGRSISKIGVTPDIKIAQPEGEGQSDVQLEKAKEVMAAMLAGTDWHTLKN